MENYLGQDIGKLGFGLMRLPEIDGKTDIEQVKKMVDMFMERGFTYYDTAFVYGNGESERVARRHLLTATPARVFSWPPSCPFSTRTQWRRRYISAFTPPLSARVRAILTII